MSEAGIMRKYHEQRHFLIDSPKEMGVKNYLFFYNQKIPCKNRTKLRELVSTLNPSINPTGERFRNHKQLKSLTEKQR